MSHEQSNRPSAEPLAICRWLTADIPGIGGELKSRPEDFEVEEIPAYLPSGHGEHLFLWIEKRDVAAEQLVRHVSRTLGIRPHDVGTAGLKDRRAIARQWVSVPAASADRIAALSTDAIRVLDQRRHGNKLKTGHLKGNRFSILIRDVDRRALERAEAIGQVIERVGFPNYFGAQRFGTGGETLKIGLRLLAQQMMPTDLPRSRRKFLLRLAVSAAQAHLFNRCLAARIDDGLVGRVLPGDVMQVVASGGLFLAQDVPTEQARLQEGETAITGPIFGPRMKRAEGEPAERESRVLKEASLTIDRFAAFGRLARGTRRPYTVRPGELQVLPEEEGVRFRFTLPPGVYATSLLREFMKTPDFAPK